MRPRPRAALGLALAVAGAVVALLGLAPHLLGDCVVWCFFGRGAGGIVAGALGAAGLLGGAFLRARPTGPT